MVFSEQLCVQRWLFSLLIVQWLLCISGLLRTARSEFVCQACCFCLQIICPTGICWRWKDYPLWCNVCSFGDLPMCWNWRWQWFSFGSTFLVQRRYGQQPYQGNVYTSIKKRGGLCKAVLHEGSFASSAHIGRIIGHSGKVRRVEGVM